MKTFIIWLDRIFHWGVVLPDPIVPPEPSVVPPTPVIIPNQPIMPPTNPDVLLPWNTTSSLSHENYHNVRVLCDLKGLSLEMKDELTATVWGESEFNTHALCVNHKTLVDGTVIIASEDNGIAQWNTHYHGTEITPTQAKSDPTMAINLMCDYFLRGEADEWVAHKTGRYLQFMGKTL